MALATASELVDRLGVEFTAAEEARAEGLLERASGLVQDEARQRIELVEDDEFTFYGFLESSVLLPERPVVEVTAVTIDGDDLAADAYRLEDDHLVYAAGWPLDTEIVVTYTHGWEEIPAAAKEVVLSMVSRVWVNPTGVVSERLGQAQMTYAVQGTPPGMLLTPEDRRTIRRLVGRGSGSLPIR
jgi:hypothetical protein